MLRHQLTGPTWTPLLTVPIDERKCAGIAIDDVSLPRSKKHETLISDVIIGLGRYAGAF